MASALLLVANPASLSAGEQFLKNRLEAIHGMTVTLHDDNAATYASPVDIVVIPENVSSTAISAKYKSTAGGVLVFEQGSWDDMSLTTVNAASSVTTNYWVTADGTQHPIANTVPSPFDMFTSAQSTMIVAPADTLGPGGQSIIHQGTRPDRCALFAYESGTMGVDSFVIPGRRVGFGLMDGVSIALAADGLKVLDNAVRWVANMSAGSLPAWSIWDGTTEQALTLEGVWTGQVVTPVTTEVVE